MRGAAAGLRGEARDAAAGLRREPGPPLEESSRPGILPRLDLFSYLSEKWLLGYMESNRSGIIGAGGVL